ASKPLDSTGSYGRCSTASRDRHRWTSGTARSAVWSRRSCATTCARPRCRCRRSPPRRAPAAPAGSRWRGCTIVVSTMTRPRAGRDRGEGRLVEGQRRDNLGAPALSVPAVAAAARAARARGVEAVLVDARGLDGAAPAVRSRLIAQITTELAGALAGSVMVRVLPPNRRLLATVVVDGPDGGIRRVEIGRDGRPQEHKVPPPASEDSVEAASVE